MPLPHRRGPALNFGFAELSAAGGGFGVDRFEQRVFVQDPAGGVADRDAGDRGVAREGSLCWVLAGGAEKGKDGLNRHHSPIQADLHPAPALPRGPGLWAWAGGNVSYARVCVLATRGPTRLGTTSGTHCSHAQPAGTGRNRRGQLICGPGGHRPIKNSKSML